MKVSFLVIDDDVAFAEIMRRTLEMDVSEAVTVAYSFEQGMEMLRSVPPPDVILMDLALGDSTSEHTQSKIPEIRAINESSVIIIVTGAIWVDEKSLLDAGADAVWPKQDLIPMPSKKNKGFLDNMRDAIESLVKKPRFQKNVKILELLAERLAKRTQALRP